MKKPKVSIIVPIYNVAPYLTICLNSVLAQKYDNLEIILVNDGSTDESGRICDEYVKTDQRITLIHQTNAGLSAARNAGLRVASGHYVSFIDSDDAVSRDFIFEMISAAILHNADVVECQYGSVFESFTRTSEQTLYTESKLNIYLQQYILTGKHEPYVWNKLYRADVISEAKFWQMGLCEDYEFNMRILSKVKSIIKLSSCLYYYRIRTGSLSRAYNLNSMACLTGCLLTKIQVMNELDFNKKNDWVLVNKWIHLNTNNIIKLLLADHRVNFRTKFKYFREIELKETGILGLLSSGFKRGQMGKRSFMLLYVKTFFVSTLKKIFK